MAIVKLGNTSCSFLALAMYNRIYFKALSAERVSADWLLKCAGCILMVIVKLGKNNIAATRVGLSQVSSAKNRGIKNENIRSFS